MLNLPAEPTCANCKHSVTQRSPVNPLEFVTECREGPCALIPINSPHGPQILPVPHICPPGYKCSRHVQRDQSNDNPS